jgi:hypothetical protein
MADADFKTAEPDRERINLNQDCEPRESAPGNLQ